MRPRWIPALAFAFLALGVLGPDATAGQVVTGTLTDAASGRPIEGALIWLLDEQDVQHSQRLTRADGGFDLEAPTPGRYLVQSERLGYQRTTSEGVLVGSGETVGISLEAHPDPVSLDALVVEGTQRCLVRPEAGAAASALWEQARKALAAVAFTNEQEVFSFRLLRYDRELGPETLEVISDRRETRDGVSANPIMSLPAEELQMAGYVQPTSGGGHTYYAPDASVLLSDPFLDGHCFTAVEGEDVEEGLVGLGFRPVPGRELPDVEGVLWLDRETAELRHLEIDFTRYPYNVPSRDLGARVEFEGLPNGAWIVRQWWIRMPRVGRSTRWLQDRWVQSFDLLGILETGGEVTNIRVRGEAVPEVIRGASVSGTVVDSTRTVEGPEEGTLIPVPIEGAQVFLSGTQFSSTTDAEGRFDLRGLPSGTYQLYFTHERLETLNLRPTAVRVDLEQDGAIEADLGVPSLRTTINRLCPGRGPGATTVVGRVRYEASGAGVPDAAIEVRWSLWDTDPAGAVTFVIEDEEGVGAQANGNGSFHVCDVPRPTRIRVRASAGEIRSEWVVVDVDSRTEIVEIGLDLPPGA